MGTTRGTSTGMGTNTGINGMRKVHGHANRRRHRIQHRHRHGHGHALVDGRVRAASNAARDGAGVVSMAYSTDAAP
eukprot:362078-Chlamydomonas_euryale.AAC.1